MKHTRLYTAAVLALALVLFSACAYAAEILPLPVNHTGTDLANGAFRLTVKDADRIDSGWFTAELFLQERYDGEQIRALSPGDTVVMNGKTWTVKELAAQIQPVIAQGNSVKPEILSVLDVESGTEDTLTPGGFLDITGKSILVTGDNDDVGLYFVNTEDETSSVKVDVSKIGVNTSSRIACVVPKLASGSYKIKIVTQFARSNAPRKDSQVNTFTNTFTVL